MNSSLKFRLPEYGILVRQAVYNISTGYSCEKEYTCTNRSPVSISPNKPAALTIRKNKKISFRLPRDFTVLNKQNTMRCKRESHCGWREQIHI